MDEPYDGPLYWLFSFDPQDGHVVITQNDDRSRSEAVTHSELAPEITHPARLNGFAYKIRGGYRITDDESKKLTDQFVIKKVLAALKGQQPSKPLPHIRPHGFPNG